MAHFYGSMHGGRGEQTCTGTKSSGMVAHIRGWNVGALVQLTHDEATGEDRVEVWRTGGSNKAGRQELLAVFSNGEAHDSEG